MVLGDVFLGQFTGKPCIGKSMNIYMVSPSLDSWSIPNTQMLHVWNIYLQDWVIFRVNVGNQLIINQQGNHRFSNDIHGVFRSIGVLPPIQRDRQKKKTIPLCHHQVLIVGRHAEHLRLTVIIW